MGSHQTGGPECQQPADASRRAAFGADSAVASEKTSNDAPASLLSGLLAPLRVPARALEALVDAAGALREVRSELRAMREQTEPLGELVPLTRELKGII